MQQKFPFPRFTLFVEVCGARLLRRLLQAEVRRQLYTSFDVSERGHLQRLLFSVVRPRTCCCSPRFYYNFPRPLYLSLHAFFVFWKAPRVVDVLRRIEYSWNHPHKVPLTLVSSANAAELQHQSAYRLLHDLHVLFPVSFLHLRLLLQVCERR